MCSLLHGDCLIEMNQIPDHSIDLVVCDPPYGVLNKSNPSAKWDSVIPFDDLWEQYLRVVKPNAAIILFGNGMFTAHLMMSKEKLWRYNLIWKKGERTTGFLNANRMPLRNHEDICVFYQSAPTYNPQFIKCDLHHRNHGKGNMEHPTHNNCYGNFVETPTIITDTKFPKSIINIQPPHKGFYHPTEKPVELMEWLILTYSNVGDTVLDNCMGSGTTGIAALELHRNFIGIEMDKNYFNIASNRIKEKFN